MVRAVDHLAFSERECDAQWSLLIWWAHIGNDATHVFGHHACERRMGAFHDGPSAKEAFDMKRAIAAAAGFVTVTGHAIQPSFFKL